MGTAWGRIVGWLWGRRGPASGASPTVLTDGRALRDWFVERRCCPDCGGTAFVEGPCGGLSQDVLCVTCHSEFCLALPLLAERVGEPLQGRLEVYGLEARPVRGGA